MSQMKSQARQQFLVDAEDSLLVVIDVQDAFLGRLPRHEGEQILDKVCWLIGVAQWSGIPVLASAEEPQKQPLAAKLVHTLPADTPVFDKMAFGLAGQPDILGALEDTRRQTAVLVGLETDVCILQSAIGLLQQEYRVAVVADATGTAGTGQETALNRMRAAGAVILNLKGLFYEWLRDIETVNRFHKELPEMRSLSGIVL